MTEENKKIRLLVFSQTPVELIGIQALIDVAEDIVVIGKTTEATEMMRLCRELSPDVVLLTLYLTGARLVRALKKLNRYCPQTKFILWGGSSDTTYARKLAVIGAVSYLLKDAAPETIIKAIRTAVHGINCFSPKVVKELVKAEGSKTNLLAEYGLTPREREVFSLMIQGLDNPSIASELNLALQTVRNYASSIYGKLNVHSRDDLKQWAREHRLEMPRPSSTPY